jgi:cytidylate kinase
MSQAPVIAVDGPGGSGKGTVCRAVAAQLGWHLLDSGALYRLVALAALEGQIDWEDGTGLARIAAALDAEFGAGPDGNRVRLGGRDVTDAIRSEACSQGASRVAAWGTVREALVGRQRAFRRWPGLVADGRDMGSVIFPDSPLKIFLTASVEERARRRYKQLKEKGIDVSLRALSRDMVERDRRDAERTVAPLRACADARTLDTTDMDIAAVIAQVLRWAAETWPDQGRS